MARKQRELRARSLIRVNGEWVDVDELPEEKREELGDWIADTIAAQFPGRLERRK